MDISETADVKEFNRRLWKFKEACESRHYEIVHPEAHSFSEFFRAILLDREDAYENLRQLYIAIHRQGWEDGPTEGEMLDRVNNLLTNRFGENFRDSSTLEPICLEYSHPDRELMAVCAKLFYALNAVLPELLSHGATRTAKEALKTAGAVFVDGGRRD